jgi:hypothetical protein
VVLACTSASELQPCPVPQQLQDAHCSNGSPVAAHRHLSVSLLCAYDLGLLLCLSHSSVILSELALVGCSLQDASRKFGRFYGFVDNVPCGTIMTLRLPNKKARSPQSSVRHNDVRLKLQPCTLLSTSLRMTHSQHARDELLLQSKRILVSPLHIM